MPEQHEEKQPARRIVLPKARPAGRQYAELYCKTNFSFLEGASHPEELVERAAELGYAALAITDCNSLAGVVRAHGAAKSLGFKLLIGAEVTPSDAGPVVLLATDRRAYGRLSRLLTLGRRKAPKGECHLTCDDVAAHAEGLIAGVTQPEEAEKYADIFGDRCYLFVQQHYGPEDERQLSEALQWSRRTGVPLVATGGVRFHDPQRRPLADVLTAIRAGCTVADAGDLLLPNAERYLKSPEQMQTLFAQAPDAVRRTVEVADRCSFSLDELRYEYPEELAPHGLSLSEYLARLTWDGARQRYPEGVPDKVRQLVEHELRLIGQLQYEAYFLTVWDLVKFARSRGILCQGRGSAANSAVCYCLGITAVNPNQQEVLFERFISAERNEAPDIDVDFEHERREEVLQYLYEKYGRERAGIVAEVICYRPRSAVRDVGKALGLSLDKVDRLAKMVDGHHGDKLDLRLQQAGLDLKSQVGRQLLELVNQLIGFPRHLGQHVGGMVMTRGPLCELAPIENAAMEGRTVIEWDKDDLDELGILKVDCLALGMLTALRKGLDLVNRHCGCDLTLATIPAEDPAVYEMIVRADTMGVFQIESRAQMSMLPRLKPERFYDLVIQIAIVRPGPIQGNMVHPYLRRRAQEEAVPPYPTSEIEAVLRRTLGVPLFQEQAMQLAIVAAGFTPGEADQLRRAMAGWRRPGLIEQFRAKLIEGMLAKGLSAEFAERVFLQIRGFGEYGFPESHAASFALLAYASAWLKCHHPAAFCAALLNSQPMGFYAPAQLVGDARRHGVEVLPPDVNFSDWDCTLENGSLRLGLRMLDGLSETVARRIEQARPYRSIADFTRRTRLGKSTVKLLANADAFRSLQLERRQALWHSLAQEQPLPLFADVEDDEQPPSQLPAMDGFEQVFADYHTQGLSLRAHPMSFFRAEMDRLKITPAAQLAETRDGRFVRVAGLVLVRQRPSTAKGITFVTLEDETGVANLIVRMEVWERYYQVARTASSLLAHGRLQNQQGVIHVLVSRLENLAGRIGAMKSQSRDFH